MIHVYNIWPPNLRCFVKREGLYFFPPHKNKDKKVKDIDSNLDNQTYDSAS